VTIIVYFCEASLFGQNFFLLVRFSTSSLNDFDSNEKSDFQDEFSKISHLVKSNLDFKNVE